MWVNKQLFDMIVQDNKDSDATIAMALADNARTAAFTSELRTQKAKDDISIDWMRHRVNALEKTNAVLMMKAAGIALPVPEIVPTRPGSITSMDGIDFGTMPSFEDCGPSEANRMGISHDESGVLVYSK